MSGILKRDVLYEKRNATSPYHFIGWSICTTGIGAMAEPFEIGDRHAPGNSYADFDFSDPMARVDELQNVPYGNSWKTLSFGETMPIHFGDLSPRVYIRSGNF